ncbi:WD repeat-containing protein 70-like [Pimephales promelas]|uniref:WD repeat-containing protein 70-like n=1 Tax=Pimephales promelas TaxID=90988 RepID=UPI00195549AC|nr:WD repeat-containing protein 70-like [Pimephales promelas]
MADRSSASGDSSNDADISSVMGFAGFGKKARTFDLEAMFEQTRRTAIERSQRALEERQKQEVQESSGFRPVSAKEKPSASTSRKQEADSDSDSDVIGPPLPPQEEEEDDDDDEVVGPPLPPGYKRSNADSDDDDDDDEDDDDDDNPVKKIPDTHEITLQHGSKSVSPLVCS